MQGAYREEMRQWSYERGIPGTPPKVVREKMRVEAENERKEAEAAHAESEKNERNGVQHIKQEREDEDEDGDLHRAEEAPPSHPLVFENYQRGQTPDYLRSGSPFLMTLEEEEEWYYEIDEKLDGGIPPIERPNSPSAVKSEGDPRNPMSVYCWLRKNQPQVFLQGDEAESGQKKGRGRRRKKHLAADVDSGDEGAAAASAKAARSTDVTKTPGSKRRRTNGSDMLSMGMGMPGSAAGASGSAGAAVGSGRGRGSGSTRGGRKKPEGSPPQKRQRRYVMRLSKALRTTDSKTARLNRTI